jgi:hypothetical protein
VAANATGNADDVYMRMAFTPFEQADRNEATQQYLDMVDEIGGQPSLLGAQATSAFLLWATAAKECGAELTRDCVLEQLGQITEWTGGGLHAQTNPAENLPPDCIMVLQMQGTVYEQVLPPEEGTFECDPEYATPVSPTVQAVAEAQLDADRTSTVFAAG